MKHLILFGAVAVVLALLASEKVQNSRKFIRVNCKTKADLVLLLASMKIRYEDVLNVHQESEGELNVYSVELSKKYQSFS